MCAMYTPIELFLKCLYCSIITTLIINTVISQSEMFIHCTISADLTSFDSIEALGDTI